MDASAKFDHNTMMIPINPEIRFCMTPPSEFIVNLCGVIYMRYLYKNGSLLYKNTY